MVRWLISIALTLAGNALGLWIASLILSDMSVDGTAFIVAVLIFTVIELIARPVVMKAAMKNAEALQGGTALIATFIGLVLTAIISDGLSIHGALTWVLATLIVWLVSVLAAVILPMIFLKKQVVKAR